MKKNFLFTIISFATLTISYGQTSNQLVLDCGQSTVSIIMEDEFKQTKLTGSGFVVGDGKILTSLNVVEGSKFGYVFLPNDPTQHKIEGYYSIDKENHLALMSVPTIKVKPLEISYRENLEIGTRAYALSHKRGITTGVNRGVVTGERVIDGRKLYQLSTPISPGSNGGAVVDKNGKVIGLALSALYSGQDINVAVPAEYIRNILKEEVKAVTYLAIPIGSAVPYIADGNMNHILKGLTVINQYFVDNISTEKIKVGDRVLSEFSLQNDFPHTLINVKILFIAIGPNGLPIDQYESVFFQGSPEEPLEAFKVKAVELNLHDWNKARALRLKAGESLEIRIVDFEFVDD